MTNLRFDGAATPIASADDPSGHYAGFTFSTARGDTAWKFMTKDGTTQNISAAMTTGFTVGKLYDFYIYCPPQGNTIYWRIDNLTDGTTEEGSVTSNLPGSSTGLRGGFQLATLEAVAKNIKFQKVYIEADR